MSITNERIEWLCKELENSEKRYQDLEKRTIEIIIESIKLKREIFKNIDPIR
jgi:hypothetical protein